MILTSLRDGTVGKSVRGVDMFNIFNKYVDVPSLDLRTPLRAMAGTSTSAATR